MMMQYIFNQSKTLCVFLSLIYWILTSQYNVYGKYVNYTQYSTVITEDSDGDTYIVTDPEIFEEDEKLSSWNNYLFSPVLELNTNGGTHTVTFNFTVPYNLTQINIIGWDRTDCRFRSDLWYYNIYTHTIDLMEEDEGFTTELVDWRIYFSGQQGIGCETKLTFKTSNPPFLVTDYFQAQFSGMNGLFRIRWQGEIATTYAPTLAPTGSPSQPPTIAPTVAPTLFPTRIPSGSPSQPPTEAPTLVPTRVPSTVPSDAPSHAPSMVPSRVPSDFPTKVPSDAPSMTPSRAPSGAPSAVPTNGPSNTPTQAPSGAPTAVPSRVPSNVPSDSPTRVPSGAPSMAPTPAPTGFPTHSPLDNSIVANGLLLISSDDYTFDMIDESEELQSNIINAIVNASINIINDIETKVDISIMIDDIIEYTEDDDTTGTAASVIDYNTQIVFEVQFPDNDILDVWELDGTQEDINEVVQPYLQKIWNDNDLRTSLTVDNSNAINTGNGAESSEIFESLYLYIGGGLLSVILLVVLASTIVTSIKKNQNFKTFALPVFGIYFLDFVSDVSFVIQVYLASNVGLLNYTSIKWYILVLGIFFIVCPMMVNMFELMRATKLWTERDVANKIAIKPWLMHHMQLLYVVSFFTGSAFAAIELFNSNLFGINVFNMGLSLRNQAIFRNKRLFSVVICENVPQIILQALYSSITNDVTPVTIISLCFSLLSAILSFMQYFAQKHLISLDNVCNIEIIIKSKHIATMTNHDFHKRQIMTSQISNYLAKSFGVDKALLELLKPIQNSQGSILLFQFVTDHSNIDDIIKVIKKQIESNSLAKHIKLVWNLHKMPTLRLQSIDFNGENTIAGDLGVFIAASHMNRTKSPSYLKGTSVGPGATTTATATGTTGGVSDGTVDGPMRIEVGSVDNAAPRAYGFSVQSNESTPGNVDQLEIAAVELAKVKDEMIMNQQHSGAVPGQIVLPQESPGRLELKSNNNVIEEHQAEGESGPGHGVGLLEGEGGGNHVTGKYEETPF